MGVLDLDLFSSCRRSLARCGEIYFAASVTDALHMTEGMTASLTENFGAFVLVSVAGSFLFDLFDTVTRPDLNPQKQASCNDDDPMLPLEK